MVIHKKLKINLDDAFNIAASRKVFYNRDIQINSFHADGSTELMNN